MVLLFNRWDSKDVKVNDLGLAAYINLDVKIVPHTFGVMAGKRFNKKKVNIVERLINKIMRTGQGKRKLSGKFIRGRGIPGNKLQAMRIVEDAFTIIEQKTKKNPLQIFVQAIENSSPREDVTRLKRGGISFTEAVDVSPVKRLDEALKNIALAAFAVSFNNKKTASEALASEIILAANNDAKSYAVKRKEETERIAKASR
ncbi:MAG: 30S ribosomal protein S7 [Candidatus Dadabacteria bacterium]|nr:MAG: 30S ribosomal protein S7 [Candidatus Dadabacteria bacterium]